MVEPKFSIIYEDFLASSCIHLMFRFGSSLYDQLYVYLEIFNLIVCIAPPIRW